MKNKSSLIWLPGLCLLVVGALVFREFLFGGAVLLYKDIGSDSLNDSYPTFVHLSDYLRSEGIPSWSFYVGMGQDLFYLSGYLILQPVVWLPRALIAHALIFQHLAKVLIAGLFFFRFLQLRGLKLQASLLGSLLLSFSAYMCMGSCWYILADEVVCFTALLLATEVAAKQGRWFLLSLAVALVGLLGSFYLYLCALFLLLYVPARLLGRYGWQPRLVLRTCLVLAVAAVLGIGLGAVITVPNLYALLNSPRGSGTTSAFATLSSFPAFGFESRLHYITAALRACANDALGTGDDFRGWGNYLEAPLTYCGLLCLVIFPQVFVRATSRQRIIYILFFMGVVLPTVYPWFRYLFWLFQGDYYRAYSLFSILGIITLSMIAFSRYLEGRILNLWLLAATAIGLSGILHSGIAELSPQLKWEVTCLLVVYSLLLAVGQLTKRRNHAAWLVMGLAALELVQFDHTTVSHRKTVRKEELSQRVGYNDETVEAVRDIKAGDNTFFRITKLRSSSPTVWRSLNDAMVFGYYGTSSYSSFNNVNYTNFLTAVDAIPRNSEPDTRWSYGLIGHPILSLFACEKYALVEDPLPFQRSLQYEFMTSYGKEYLFRNARFLPLGLTFTRYMEESVFMQLPSWQKPEALLHAVVLSSNTTKDGFSELTTQDLVENIRNAELPDLVAQLRTSALTLKSFRQRQLEGVVRLDQRSILVVQTPFDRGWHAFQDGKVAPVLKVDVGLLGVVLDAGEHRVTLSYSTPFLGYGATITLASLALLGLGWWRWPRVHLREKN